MKKNKTNTAVKWHDLGNGVNIQAELSNDMQDRLNGLVQETKDGKWRHNFERVVVDMLIHANSSANSLVWYGHMIAQCRIIRDCALPSPAGVNFQNFRFNLFINPLLFGLYTLKAQIAILKHEMQHITNLHIFRKESKVHETWNYATDISINPGIQNIPHDCLMPETFGFPPDLNAEQYYDLLPKDENNKILSPALESNGDESIIDDDTKLKDMISSALNAIENGVVGDHSKWGEYKSIDKCAKEIARQMTDTASQKSRGHIPAECATAISLLGMQEQVNWKKELRVITGNKKSSSRLTIKRRDRRFPLRNDLRGKTKDRILDILVVLDVSGSFSDDEIRYGLSEVRAIAKNTNAGIILIQVDTEPKLVNDFQPLAKEFTRTGMGGTYLYSAIEFAMNNKLRFDAVVMITDGGIEKHWNGKIPAVPFIWLITNDVKNLNLDISQFPRMKAFELKM